MLDEKEIKKIIDLIEQGKSNYRIWKETGHSVNTIGLIRGKNKKSEKKQIQEEDALMKNPIELVRKITSDIHTLIQTAQINDRERNDWGKRFEKLQGIIRVEVDDRIPKERVDAVLQRDKEWNRHIEQNYVKKEVVTNLESTIQASEMTIISLRKEIGDKDEAHEKDQTTIFNLLDTQRNMQYQIQNLTKENKVLNNNNWGLHNYIENRLDIEVKQTQDQLKNESKDLIAEKTRFDEFRKNNINDLNNSDIKLQQREKTVELREKQVAEREEKLQKQENELRATQNRWNIQYSEMITSIKKRVEDIAGSHCDEMVKRSFDKQLNEINQQWKEINNQKAQLTKEREALNKLGEEQRTKQ